MFMGEINTTYSGIQTESGSTRALLQPCLRTWETLSLPERQELQTTLKRCNRSTSSEVELLISSISNSEVRYAALSLLCRKDCLIRNPISRGRLLESLIPYSNECRVQAYAMLSLRNEFYSRSYPVCAPAARIIEATKSNRDPSITYELLDLAARVTPQGRDAAAKIAFILLKDSLLTSGQYHLVLFQARVWYIENKGTSNPWLEIVAQYKKLPAVRFLRAVIEGNVSDPREYPVLKNVIALPLLPHEIALTASILTLTAQKLANFFGVVNNFAAPTSALLATALIVGSRYMWRAHNLDKINARRTFEKLEAINHLQTLHESSNDLPTPIGQKLRGEIQKALREQTFNFLQDEAVQKAAQQALSHP